MFTQPSSPSRPVHTETISIPRGIFQSNWQHIPHTLYALTYLCKVPILQLGRLRQYGINCLAQEQTKVPRPGIEPATY